MNSIPDLYKELNEVEKDITNYCSSHTSSKDEMKELHKLIKQWDLLAPKIQEETLVLHATKKESSPTMIRYNAKLHVLVNQFKNLYKRMTTHLSPRAAEIAADPELHAFYQFVKERVRSLRDGYNILTNEKVTLKEIVKAYNRWAVCNKSQRLKVEKIKELCDKAFGEAKIKDNETIGSCAYWHIRVFIDEEDVEDFDKEYSQHESI